MEIRPYAEGDREAVLRLTPRLTEGVLRGFVTVTLREHWSGGTDGYLGELVVAPDAEGDGVGRALVERAEQWAHDRGAARLGLETGAANTAARAFYAALGFEEEDVRLSRAL